MLELEFWSSDKLTGNQTVSVFENVCQLFWSSDKLTGNQTPESFEAM